MRIGAFEVLKTAAPVNTDEDDSELSLLGVSDEEYVDVFSSGSDEESLDCPFKCTKDFGVGELCWAGDIIMDDVLPIGSVGEVLDEAGFFPPSPNITYSPTPGSVAITLEDTSELSDPPIGDPWFGPEFETSKLVRFRDVVFDGTAICWSS